MFIVRTLRHGWYTTRIVRRTSCASAMFKPGPPLRRYVE